MVLTIYINWISPPSRALALLLYANGVPFEMKLVDLLTGEQNSEEFAKLNPSKHVPVINDDGFALPETVAILKYLCAAKPEIKEHWYPKDLQQRAHCDEYMGWQHTGVRRAVGELFVNRVFLPMKTNKTLDDERVKQAKASLDTNMDFIENYFLKRSDFVAGDQITIADLMCICEIIATPILGYDFMKGRPKVAAWVERVKGELQPHFDSCHEEMYHSLQMMVKKADEIK